MSDLAIRAVELGKKYRIGAAQARYSTLRDQVADLLVSPFRRMWSGRAKRNSQDDTIWALRNVSLDVQRGEVVGVIGRNGAGKTTLLKVLSRIMEPTEGRAEIHGRIGSLLEVGTGFHPELTGRENIYLNGAILGMRSGEIDRKFDEIVAFAEVEKFIDTPVKRYSSGMYVRLAFSVAAHLEPEILLVDEVLAVGDAAFQKKCMGKMGEVAGEGRTILFVSHNMGAITRLCERSIWLDKGGVRLDGYSEDVVRQYLSEGLKAQSQWTRADSKNRNEHFTFLGVTVRQPSGTPSGVFETDEQITVEITYAVRRELSECHVAARVHNSSGIAVFTTTDADVSGLTSSGKSPGQYRSQFTIPANFLSPDNYYILVAAHVPHQITYDVIEETVVFEVSALRSLTSLDGRYGVVEPLLPWEVHKDDSS